MTIWQVFWQKIRSRSRYTSKTLMTVTTITRDIMRMNICSYAYNVRINAHVLFYSYVKSHREYAAKNRLRNWPCCSCNLYTRLWVHLRSTVPCLGCSVDSSGCKCKGKQYIIIETNGIDRMRLFPVSKCFRSRN